MNMKLLSQLSYVLYYICCVNMYLNRFQSISMIYKRRIFFEILREEICNKCDIVDAIM